MFADACCQRSLELSSPATVLSSRFLVIAFLFAMTFAVLFSSRARAVVISEIHYNPPGDDTTLEWVELTNETTTPEDISGYRFESGIFFEIPPRTILRGGDSLVICSDVDAVVAEYGIDNAIGDFIGRLDGSGERLIFVTQAGIEIQNIRYRDEGKWPTAPDGSGHTLALRDLLGDTSEPESWSWSLEIGGTPGIRNFPSEDPTFRDTTVIGVGEDWRYERGDAAFSNPADAWKDSSFVDTGWSLGPTGIGYGDGDDATEINDMRENFTTIAARKRFDLTAEDLETTGEYILGIDFDDGFCAFLNGVLVASANCAANSDHTSTATASREAGNEQTFPIPIERFVEGENVLAILGVNRVVNSSDFSLIPRLVLREELVGGGGDRPAVFVNELGRGPDAADRWIEFYNRESGPVDIGGFELHDGSDATPHYTIPGGTSIPAGGFWAVRESTSGLDFSSDEVRAFLVNGTGLVVAAETFDKTAPEDLVGTAWAECRYPDGGDLDWVTATPTEAAPNEVDATTDVVINEIFYQAPEDRLDEFLELYNRGDSTVDLGGFRFNRGITFAFADGTTIGAGEYLVLARFPDDVESVYGLDGVLGPYEGTLANGGERLQLVDPWGNPADTLRYYDGGRWAHWANGRGSSLELIDPHQDNSVASAWEASDEDDKAEWEQLSYSVPAYVGSSESELHLFLAEKGRCLIDDVSVRRGAGSNHISNGGFETTTSPWRIEGTHIHSRRTTADSHSGNACLEIITSGKGDTGVNRLETDTSPRLSNGPYEVSLWARWLRGTSLIISHGEFNAGSWGGRPGPSTNLSGNRLGGQFRMTVPRNLGTPGAENSVTAQLRVDTGDTNLGPVISNARHSPASVPANSTIRVSAEVSDSDGIASVRVHYRTRSPNGVFAAIDMSSVGNNVYGNAEIFRGSIPGASNLTKVVYYIEATDTDGEVRRFPRDAPDRTLLLQVQSPVNTTLDSARWILDDAQNSVLSSRRLHSNDLLDGSFVFDNNRHYHNVGVRYRGSPWGRPSRANFRVGFNKDDRMHRGRTALNFTSRGTAANEKAGYFLCGRNGTTSVPAPTSDYFFVRAYYNGASRGTYGMMQSVDGDYLEKWYGPDAEGPILKAVGRLQFNDSGSRTGWDGASYVHMNGEAENYRAYYFHSVNQTRDDWESLARLTRVMDRRVTGTAAFDQQIGGVMNLEAWFRIIAVRILIGGWDAFSIGNGHNGYLVYDSVNELWGILPFDMDNTFQQGGFPIFPTADADVSRMMGRPLPRRAYYRVLADLLDGYWNTANCGPYFTALQQQTGIGTGGITNFINSRRATAQNTIRTSLNVNFAITTNGGQDMSVETESVRLEGTASVRVAHILVERTGEDPEIIEPQWPSTTRWRYDFDLLDEETIFSFTAFDTQGEIIDSDSIKVTSLVLSDDPRVIAWSPSSGPVEGGTDFVIVGRNLPEGLEVYFGEARASSVTVESPTTVLVVVPRAVAPFPEDGFVDLRLVLPDGAGEIVVERAFEYTGTPPEAFVRGDSNRDFRVNISDVMKTLFFLFRGEAVECEDAADFDDDGEVTVTDAIAELDFLFREGPPPAAPYPNLSTDPTDDAISCE